MAFKIFSIQKSEYDHNHILTNYLKINSYQQHPCSKLWNHLRLLNFSVKGKYLYVIIYS